MNNIPSRALLDRRVSRGGDGDEETERRLSVMVSIAESVPEIEAGVKEFCRQVLEATPEQLESSDELLGKARLLPQFAIFRRFRNADDATRVIQAFHDGRLAACVRKLWELKKKKVRIGNDKQRTLLLLVAACICLRTCVPYCISISLIVSMIVPCHRRSTCRERIAHTT